MTENEFLVACQRHTPQITRYAKTVSGSVDDAADIVQETIALAWRKRDQYDPTRSAFGTWFVSIYHNVVRRKYRDQYENGIDNNIISIDDLIAVNEESQADALVMQPDYDDRILLEQALVILGGIHERVVRECFIGGMTFNEIGVELGLSKRKVGRLLNTALKRLKRILTGGK